ncbi:hypothetical protein PM082_005953 [Marasmius tenuissimus]|nr:hypothetical protein PM082_005953 [Marasmius tenuissimus]
MCKLVDPGRALQLTPLTHHSRSSLRPLQNSIAMSNVSDRRITCLECGSVKNGRECEVCRPSGVLRSTQEHQRLLRVRRITAKGRIPGDGSRPLPVQNVYHDHEEYSWTTNSGGFSRMIVQYSGAKNASGWNDADFGSKGSLAAGQVVGFIVMTAVLIFAAISITGRNSH